MEKSSKINYKEKDWNGGVYGKSFVYSRYTPWT